MLKTVLVTPPEHEEGFNPLPLLGPSILKTFLDSNGYQTDLVDLAIRIKYLNRFRFRKIFNLKLFENRERVVNFLENGEGNEMRADVEKMIRLGNLTTYDVVGFTLHATVNLPFSLCLSKVLKEKYNKKIVFGGAMTTRADYTSLLDFDFIDFLVVGDGEKPFLNILRYLEGNGSIENCDGIFYKKDGEIHSANTETFPIENRSIPSFNAGDLKLYKKLSTIGLSTLPYLLSIGCRFKCAFCCEYNNSLFTYTPLGKVISDIRILLKTYKANSIFFAEGNLNNNPNYVKELSEHIIKEKLKFSWGGFFSIVGLDESKIKLMAKSGCKFLFVGVESGSEVMSTKMNLQKKKDMEQFKETLKLLHKYGIKTHNFFIVEFPYETFDDFKKTIRFIKETAKYFTSGHANMFTLVENSSMFKTPQAFNIRKHSKNIDKYSLLDNVWGFDEVKGLKWEEKIESGLFKLKITNEIINKQMLINVTLRSLFSNPLFVLKKEFSHPYPNLDKYFM